MGQVPEGQHFRRAPPKDSIASRRFTNLKVSMFTIVKEQIISIVSSLGKVQSYLDQLFLIVLSLSLVSIRCHSDNPLVPACTYV